METIPSIVALRVSKVLSPDKPLLRLPSKVIGPTQKSKLLATNPSVNLPLPFNVFFNQLPKSVNLSSICNTSPKIPPATIANNPKIAPSIFPAWTSDILFVMLRPIQTVSKPIPWVIIFWILLERRSRKTKPIEVPNKTVKILIQVPLVFVHKSKII